MPPSHPMAFLLVIGQECEGIEDKKRILYYSEGTLGLSAGENMVLVPKYPFNWLPRNDGIGEFQTGRAFPSPRQTR